MTISTPLMSNARKHNDATQCVTRTVAACRTTVPGTAPVEVEQEGFRPDTCAESAMFLQFVSAAGNWEKSLTFDLIRQALCSGKCRPDQANGSGVACQTPDLRCATEMHQSELITGPIEAVSRCNGTSPPEARRSKGWKECHPAVRPATWCRPLPR